MASAGLASRQRQILDDLCKEYQRRLSGVLRQRELIKGSVYGLKTRCGNPTCHLAARQFLTEDVGRWYRRPYRPPPKCIR